MNEPNMNQAVKHAYDVRKLIICNESKIFNECRQWNARRELRDAAMYRDIPWDAGKCRGDSPLIPPFADYWKHRQKEKAGQANV